MVVLVLNSSPISLSNGKRSLTLCVEHLYPWVLQRWQILLWELLVGLLSAATRCLRQFVLSTMIYGTLLLENCLEGLESTFFFGKCWFVEAHHETIHLFPWSLASLEEGVVYFLYKPIIPAVFPYRYWRRKSKDLPRSFLGMWETMDEMKPHLDQPVLWVVGSWVP